MAAFKRNGCRGRDEGLTLALATVATYAVYIVGVNKSCVQHEGEGLKMVFFILLSATIIFAGNLFMQREIPNPFQIRRLPSTWILLALIPHFGIRFDVWCWPYSGSVRRRPRFSVALEPLTAVALGIFPLERFVAEQFAGVALIVAAVMTVILGGRPGRFSVRRLIPTFMGIFA